VAFYRKSGGSNVAITTLKRRSGSTWVNVQTVKRRSGGTWVTVWSAYTPITLSGPTTASGSYQCSGQSPSPCPTQVTIQATPATPIAVSGGNPGPTVSWAWVSGDVFTVSNGSTLQPTFSIGSVGHNITKTGVYRCTVSDGVSSATRDVTVSVTYTWDNGL